MTTAPASGTTAHALRGQTRATIAVPPRIARAQAGASVGFPARWKSTAAAQVTTKTIQTSRSGASRSVTSPPRARSVGEVTGRHPCPEVVDLGAQRVEVARVVDDHVGLGE